MGNGAVMTGGQDQGGLKGRHVLYSLIAFFGVIFAVNGVFLYSALKTNTGVVANEPYRKGLAYNERIAADERQKALGWQEQTSLASDGRVSVVIKGADGKPVSGLYMDATLGRPSTTAGEQKLKLAEVEPGVYAAASKAVEAGTWLFAVEARRADNAEEPIYRARRRLWLKP